MYCQKVTQKKNILKYITEETYVFRQIFFKKFILMESFLARLTNAGISIRFWANVF